MRNRDDYPSSSDFLSCENFEKATFDWTMAENTFEFPSILAALLCDN